jgi:ribosome-binding ATPase YchF (GTP1/OBG family)
MRSVPIELLDVAGLVPGAHMGKGLGNKFLDDLRHADALIHVVDASGTTDAEGKATRGYDPSQDILWLKSEIVNWVLGNLMQKWGGIKRRHIAIKAGPVETLQGQFSGYGGTSTIIARALDKLALKQPLQDWDNDTIKTVVVAFVDEKFPTVYALNKIDHPDADKNISKIAKQEPPERIVLCSAISEVFLRKLAKQDYIRYVPGSEFVDTREDLIDGGEADGGGLKEMDEKLKSRIENMKDMVLYRFGSTGVNQVLSRAAELLGLVPVFPVRNIGTFGSGEAGTSGGDRAAVFRDCVLVRKGSTVGDAFRKIMGDAPLAYVETIGGVRVSEDDEVKVGKNDVRVFPETVDVGCNIANIRPDPFFQSWKSLRAQGLQLSAMNRVIASTLLYDCLVHRNTDEDHICGTIAIHPVSMLCNINRISDRDKLSMVIHGQLSCPCNLCLLTCPCCPLASSTVLVRGSHGESRGLLEFKLDGTQSWHTCQCPCHAACMARSLPTCSRISSTWSAECAHRPGCLYWQPGSITSHTSRLQLTVASLSHDQNPPNTPS